ncbi:hypothetical protein [Zobellia uliginosa]|uniref:hypothetical protein n=1 Tax=Zobellia uliginosa TaxID=143224 RepID=UPI001C0785A0|nr:hypothetical protein [Zobellia uliginosa]MBU2947398.1 hypothetical protein [Zobellia uliginosa]
MPDKTKVTTGSFPEPATNPKGWFTFENMIALAVLIAYGIFIYFLIGKVDSGDPSWSRLIYLFSGVEAIVFAAVGFLFGKEVNRKRAEKAETEKKEVEEQKEKIKDEKVAEHNKGLVLGAMIMQAEGGQKKSMENRGLEMEMSSGELQGIAAKARKLYPELDT